MELKTSEAGKAVRQLPKLKSLLNKYRHLTTMQSGLLQLSELASNVTDMESFYPALKAVINSFLNTDNFYIVLANEQAQLTLAYQQNQQLINRLPNLSPAEWLTSLIGQVFIQKHSIHCNFSAQEILKKQGVIHTTLNRCEDWLGVPLIRGSHVVGVLAVENYSKQHTFSEKDEQLLSFIAEYLVIAIDRVRNRELLEKSIQQRTKKLTEINQQLQREIAQRQRIEKAHQAMLSIAEATVKITTFSAFYQTIHQEISALLYADNIFIALLSGDKKHLSFPYHIDEKFENPGPRALVNGLTEYILEHQQPILIVGNTVFQLTDNDVIIENTKPKSLYRPLQSKAFLGAPLMADGEILGVIAIQHYHDAQAYKTEDLALIRFVSHHIAIAIERKQQQQAKENQQLFLEQLVAERTLALQESNQQLRRQIEERRQIEQRLYHEAHHDVLTQLPNRALLSDRLTQALKHLKRYPQHKFAVLFIDLDRFKIINDTLGHQAGDEFLIEVAKRLKDSVRENDVLARLGGDEFVILLDALDDFDCIEEISQRIISNIEKPFEFKGNFLHSSASIGITIVTAEYQDANDILRDADAAMYQAKNLGRGRYMFFDISMREQLMASLSLEQELRKAIQLQQFELHYQQINNLQNDEVIGFEALLRWQHPERGQLTPSDFLFMAEETGMITEIETWVIEQACLKIQQWQQSTQYKHAFISVNLTGHQLTNVNQLNALIRFLKQQPIALEQLILEFDEVAFTQQPENALKSLRRLKDLGVKLALDDYGSGLSSFNFVHSYPFEFIKLDRSFIRAINHNDKNLSLIKVLLELGQQFGYRLVAEGIESHEMLTKLTEAGCEFGQGYYFNKPARLEDETVSTDLFIQYAG
jgi:diguanylate cyclase (GGDEF)-like protein